MMNSPIRLSLTFFVVCSASGVAHAQQPAGAPSTPSAAAKFAVDPHAMELLQQSQEAMLHLKTYQAESRTTISRYKPLTVQPDVFYRHSFLLAEKPNHMRFEDWQFNNLPVTMQWTRPNTIPSCTVESDGKHRWTQIGSGYSEDRKTTPKDMKTLTDPWWRGFYSTGWWSPYGMAMVNNGRDLVEARIEGKEIVDGVTCDKVIARTRSMNNGKAYTDTETWFLDSDHQVRRNMQEADFGDGRRLTYESSICNIKLNDAIDAASFSYSPPAGVVPDAAVIGDPTVAPNGSAAPDFTAKNIVGKAVKLSDFRGSVVVLDFWDTHCAPCMESMPHNQAVIKKLRGAGIPVVMLALDDWEDRSEFDKWVKTKGRSYPSLCFVHIDHRSAVSESQYKVNGIPTQFVIDPNGVIRTSFVGYAKPTDDLENAVRAALKVTH